ncbi:hypothetical protein DCS_06140 [Drechmeria coniospora]|uniref:Uncharacterized protein n=1 Tax=Drechmeria coniospora TaxID=98403 RepID=A0A151GAR5_DRECN|nr:hypothetical protein DCS_06140 [Drechmeria coniospora]KYK54183.1 hypothetical protein DCS_06140 [Drechmeria coniospora]ODA77513.1 hypothetical protein RJ55_07142 [Drechmeria coniospora]
MESSNSGRYFATNQSEAERRRKAAKSGNKHGNPITVPTKILAAVADPTCPESIFTAGAMGFVYRISLPLAKRIATYRGPEAPATCLALGGREGKTIFAGSWDKVVWSWDIESTKPGLAYRGHSDFVKAVVCTRLAGKEILISGGADKKILVWDVETGRCMHTVQDPTTTMLAVQFLAVDPVATAADAVVVFSASSDPHIRRWQITLDGCQQLPDSFHDRPGVERPTIEEHDTSVYKLVFDVDGDETDLWTASADGTAKCLARSRNFVADDVFAHGDFVRAVLVTDHWVITAGRDEHVKVWDRVTGKLYCQLEGHFEEVTELVMLRNAQGLPDKFCSVSIDRTIRTWPLDKAELDDVVRKIHEPPMPTTETPAGGGDKLLTAEEEAELAELMDD